MQGHRASILGVGGGEGVIREWRWLVVKSVAEVSDCFWVPVPVCEYACVSVGLSCLSVCLCV